MFTPYMPTPNHLVVITECERLLHKWTPVLPWLLNWHITILPCPENDEEWGMQIETAPLLNGAVIWVKEQFPAAGVRFMPQGEYNLELIFLHELSHLLFSHLTMTIHQIIEQTSIVDIEEEKAVWYLARALMRLQQESSH